MNSRIPYLVVAAASGFFVINAAALTELRFSEAQMPLGTTASIVSLAGGEYVGYGITTFNAYRYGDGRDPFSDGAENGPSGPWGLSMDSRATVARIDLSSPTTLLQVDWWTIAGTLFLDVYDTGGNDIHSFSGAGFGTETLNAPNIS